MIIVARESNGRVDREIDRKEKVLGNSSLSFNLGNKISRYSA